ncbi:unnamed protein product [Effrenium voratum]|uniref:EF-hand domain-containing protein n=1 Tax=Effrenium voratum TaxID=2562239 RepID=A0AA36JTC9_9DINO|nr:unnamed protein product [Effrenium voratum]CAJ1411539.1 unnamed protein product [Effrenium voratum]CAJ1435690.1 unnamed protein product [Effrenium voratum]
MERSRLARAASTGSLPGKAKHGRLEDLCRPRLGRASVRSNGRAYHKPFEVAYREIAELRNFRRLENLFVEADADRSGEMSLDEFRNALRKPWFQRSFSLLGVQPHQAEVVFKKMNKANAEEIGISDFMQGLESLLGTDLDGPPRDLDVSSLSSRLQAKTKLTVSPSRSDPSLSLSSQGSTGWDGPVQGSDHERHISAAMAVLSPTTTVKKKVTRRRASTNQATERESQNTADGSPTNTDRRLQAFLQ